MITVIGFANTVGQGLMVLYSEVPEVGEKSGQLPNYIFQEQTIYYQYLPTVDLVAFGAYELINHTSQTKGPPQVDIVLIFTTRSVVSSTKGLLE